MQSAPVPALNIGKQGHGYKQDQKVFHEKKFSICGTPRAPWGARDSIVLTYQSQKSYFWGYGGHIYQVDRATGHFLFLFTLPTPSLYQFPSIPDIETPGTLVSW